MRRAGYIAAFVACSACRERPRLETKPVASVAASASSASSASVPAVRTKRGGMNVTFLIVSDTHFGYEGIEKQNEKLITRVNALPGHPYPAKIGGSVAPPRGLVVTGDLTEWGRKAEWQQFVEMFGLRGTEGSLKLPVFEMVGNHDKVETGPWIGDQVALRHGGRFYSWDWDDLHLLALGEAPDDEGLAFLARDLERVSPEIPLVLFFHLALAGPWSTGNWFDDGFKGRLVKALEGRKVAAIFHGHHHATGHYVWQSLDVWKPGAVKNDAHTLAVVHVSDTKWTLASYDWERDVWGATFEKPLP